MHTEKKNVNKSFIGYGEAIFSGIKLYIFNSTVRNLVQLKFVNNNQIFISPRPTKYLLTINKLFSQSTTAQSVSTVTTTILRNVAKIFKNNTEKLLKNFQKK